MEFVISSLILIHLRSEFNKRWKKKIEEKDEWDAGFEERQRRRGDEMKENKSKVLSILLLISNGSIYLYPIPYILFYVFHSMYFPLRVCPPIPCIPFYVSHFVYPNPCISHSPYACPIPFYLSYFVQSMYISLPVCVPYVCPIPFYLSHFV